MIPRLNGSDPAHPDLCVRCGRTARCFIGSVMNTDWICLPCRDDEGEAPGFAAAAQAEQDAVKAGNFNFPGVGFTSADRVFLSERLKKRP